jgi:DNA-binding response OmpR family regulator
MLKRKGVKVDKAYSAEEALEKIREKVYDVYLIDYDLPRINGVDIARKAREMNKEGKVIIITANVDFKTSEFSVIYKPFDLESFYTNVFE